MTAVSEYMCKSFSMPIGGLHDFTSHQCTDLLTMLITAIFGLFDDPPWLFGLPQNSAVDHIALRSDKFTVNAVNRCDVQQIEDMVLCDGKV